MLRIIGRVVSLSLSFYCLGWHALRWKRLLAPMVIEHWKHHWRWSGKSGLDNGIQDLGKDTRSVTWLLYWSHRRRWTKSSCSDHAPSEARIIYKDSATVSQLVNLLLHHRRRIKALGIRMKYTSTEDTTSWEFDNYGNRVDKETGEFVVLADSYKETQAARPEAFVRVDGEWLPKQTEFDFE